MKYLIIYEQTTTGYSAYSPDVDGCVATGSSMAEVAQNIADAIEFHIVGMIAEGLDIPTSKTTAGYSDIAV